VKCRILQVLVTEQRGAESIVSARLFVRADLVERQPVRSACFRNMVLTGVINVSVFKVAFFFEAFGAGWSEIWWYSTSSSNPQDVATPAQTLAQLRMKLCAEDINMPYIRVSLVDTPRVVYPVPAGYTTDQTATTGIKITPALTSGPGQVYGAVQCRSTTSDSLYSRLSTMRGMPATLEPKTGYPFLGGTLWSAAFNNFAQVLTQQPAGWQFRALDKGAISVNIVAINAVIGGYTNIVTDSTITPKVGMKIHVFKGDGLGLPRGNFTITTVTDTLNFNIKWTLPQGWFYNSGGKVRPNSYVYKQINKIIAQSWTHRKPGRPFAQPVGRRLVRSPYE
jgi:hypothetical protein